MPVSRSAALFLRRHGLVLEDVRPLPRFSPDDLLVNFIPVLAPPGPSREALQAYEGDPSPDRGPARDWPRNTLGDD